MTYDDDAMRLGATYCALVSAILNPGSIRLNGRLEHSQGTREQLSSMWCCGHRTRGHTVNAFYNA
jgi:hypothetical protein